MFGQLIRQEFVFADVPFPSCHASTVLPLDDGKVLVAWFGGTHEKHEDVGVWVSVRDNDRWSFPQEVANGVQHADKRYPCWNPVLMMQPTGEISLFYKVGPNPREWWGMVITSSDGGYTWSIPRRLPEDILGPVKNKAIFLKESSWLCPSSTEHDGWKVHMEITDDFGATWKRIGPIDGGEIQAIQPTILRHEGKLQLLCRSKKSGIVESWSEDQGLNWSPLKPTDLPNPNSGIDGVSMGPTEHYLVFNPTSTPEGEWGGDRHPLVLGVSTDGANWKILHTLESMPGEYSYPAIAASKDGYLHITYTYKREKIKHVVYRP